MASSTSDSLEHVFLEFSKKRATKDALLRALVSYGDWLVPSVVWAVHYRPGNETIEVEKEAIALSVECRLPGTELWLFTGHKAALRAKEQGALLGLCINGIRGTELFGNLNPEWEWVRVNPGSPPEVTVNFPRAGFPDAKMWAKAIAFEEAIVQERPSELAAIGQQLRSYDNFLILLHADRGNVVTLVNHRGLATAVVAFTAPDCQQAFLDKLPAEQRVGFRPMTTTGPQLAETPRGLGVDGIIVNPFGPGPTAVLPL
jgi:hypothetical protein